MPIVLAKTSSHGFHLIGALIDEGTMSDAAEVVEELSGRAVTKGLTVVEETIDDPLLTFDVDVHAPIPINDTTTTKPTQMFERIISSGYLHCPSFVAVERERPTLSGGSFFLQKETEKTSRDRSLRAATGVISSVDDYHFAFL